MAELAKKLRIQSTQGAIEVCSLYSTREEANARGGVLPLIVDGVSCFAALGPLNEEETTRGRQEKNGVKMAILKRGTIPPGSISYDFSKDWTAKTFTVPRGVKMLRISSPSFNPDTVYGGGRADLYYMPVTPGEVLPVSFDTHHNEETAEDETYFIIGGVEFFLHYDDVTLILSWSEAINTHTSKIKRR